MKKIIMLLFVFICVGTCFGCVEPPNPSDVYFDVTIDFDNGEQISTIKVKKANVSANLIRRRKAVTSLTDGRTE